MERAAAREARVQAQAEQRAREDKVAGDAAAWKAARSAHPAHPYPVRKQIDGSGLKQGAAGQTVPMTDGKGDQDRGQAAAAAQDAEGGLWNIQVISAG